MKRQSFSGPIRAGHKQEAVEVPFDPAQAWGVRAQSIAPGRRGFAVQGRLNGVPFSSHVVARSRRFWVLLEADVERLAGVAVDDTVEVSLEPHVA